MTKKIRKKIRTYYELEEQVRTRKKKKKPRRTSRRRRTRTKTMLFPRAHVQLLHVPPKLLNLDVANAF